MHGMNRSLAQSCLLLSLLVLPSCFLGRQAINEPLDPVAVASLQPGVTARDVVAKMGAPDEVVQLGRRTAYRYSFTVTKGTGSWWILLGLYNEDSRRDMAWFFFDEDLRLTHKGSTFQSHRAGFHGVPWSEVYDPADKAAADAVRGLK